MNLWLLFSKHALGGCCPSFPRCAVGASNSLNWRHGCRFLTFSFSLSLSFFFFLLFRAICAAHGSSLARGWIRAVATTTEDLSHICDLHHSSRQHQLLKPLSKAWARTCILMDTSQIRYRWAMTVCWAPRCEFQFLIPATLILGEQSQIRRHEKWTKCLKLDAVSLERIFLPGLVLYSDPCAHGGLNIYWALCAQWS